MLVVGGVGVAEGALNFGEVAAPLEEGFGEDGEGVGAARGGAGFGGETGEGLRVQGAGGGGVQREAPGVEEDERGGGGYLGADRGREGCLVEDGGGVDAARGVVHGFDELDRRRRAKGVACETDAAGFRDGQRVVEHFERVGVVGELARAPFVDREVLQAFSRVHLFERLVDQAEFPESDA